MIGRNLFIRNIPFYCILGNKYYHNNDDNHPIIVCLTSFPINEATKSAGKEIKCVKKWNLEITEEQIIEETNRKEPDHWYEENSFITRITTAISIGWDCSLSTYKYNACPFDVINTNYDGMIQCICEDFADFCNPIYLRLITLDKNYFNELEYKKGDQLIVNTKYRFIFSRESPNQIQENWKYGSMTYCVNHFQELINVYQKRIDNFRNYIHSGTHIYFILTKICSIDYGEFKNMMEQTYPNCSFTIIPMEETRYVIFNECMDFMKTNFYGL
jgi:hypothetical protein